nr:hypothetical protein [Kibdelosporangium sp. MJ126-NF4]
MAFDSRPAITTLRCLGATQPVSCGHGGVSRDEGWGFPIGRPASVMAPPCASAPKLIWQVNFYPPQPVRGTAPR